MSGLPLFFSFDGIDGVGKSTQVKLFCDWLGHLGYDVTQCRDPGSTQVGEALREIVLGSTFGSIDGRCEMLVYMAARAQLVAEIVRPALDSGRVVVSDRYLLANVVYQGHAGGLDVDQIRCVGEVATGGVFPTRTFLLDMVAEEAAQRIARRKDRMEQRGMDYHRRVREGFRNEAARRPDHILLIDAARPIDVVQEEIRRLAQPLLD